MNLDYFYAQESEQFLFYQIPQILFTDARYKQIPAESKILYGLLLSRMGLSRKNNWLDDNGRVYIIYTNEQIMESLGCKKAKAISLLKHLKDIGSVTVKRQGLGKPNIIYVKNIFSLDNTPDESDTKSNISEVGKTDFKKYEKRNCRSRKI